MRLVIPSFLSIICLLLVSCSLKQQHVLFDQKKASENDSASAKAVNYVYRIKNDDELQIRNLQDYKFLANESSSSAATSAGGQTYRVDDEGKVTLPVLGHVPVAGLTKLQAQRKIEQLYSDSLLKKPIIELKVLNLSVTVLGEISGQGKIPLTKEKMTLIDAIALAGGISKSADEKNVKIIRNQGKEVIWADLGDINILSDPKIILKDNDIIYIAQNKRAVRDDKIQNFSSLVSPSLLIFNTALIILTLFR